MKATFWIRWWVIVGILVPGLIGGLAGCSSEDDPTSPTNPGPPSTVGVTVSRATHSYIASAHIGVGSAGTDQQESNESFEFLDDREFSGGGGAGAAVGDDVHTGTASASCGYSGTAEWPSPGVLSSLTWDVSGEGSVNLTGPFTIAYGGAGGYSGFVGVTFTVPAAGVDLAIKVTADVGAKVFKASGGGPLDTWDDEEHVFNLEAGEYRISLETGGGAQADPPPFSESGAGGGTAEVNFLTPAP